MKSYIKKIKNIKDKFAKFNGNEIDNVLDVLNNKNIDYVKKLETHFCKKFKVVAF